VRLVACGVWSLVACACACAAEADGLFVEPRVWNYGVRPRHHIVTRRVTLRSPAQRARIGQVQVACECLTARVVTADETAEAPAEIELEMYTEEYEGKTAHAVFVALERPAGPVVRIDVVGWVVGQAATAAVEVFYPAGEPGGREFVAWLDGLGDDAAARRRLDLRPIEDVSNYRLLREREEAASLRGPPAEVIAFVDRRIALVGLDEVASGLAALLGPGLDMRPGRLSAPATPEIPSQAATAADAATAPAPALVEAPPQGGGVLEVRLYYFSNCRRCRTVLDELRAVADRHAGRVDVEAVDCAKEHRRVVEIFAAAQRNPDAPAVLPSVIALVGTEILYGEDAILGSLDRVVSRQLARGGAAMSIADAAGDAANVGVLDIALVPILLAALADGVNPCAFAAIVVLISVIGASRLAGGTGAARDLAVGGGSFCAGVFAAYYAAGMAALSVFGELGTHPIARAALFWVVCSMAAAGAVLSGLDAVVYLRTGDPGRLRLKVPSRLRALFAPVMRGRLRGMGLVFGGFAAGVVIAALEGMCTGQMYLPTIQYMARTEGLRARGAVLLLVYNVLFVMPLVAILVAAVSGMHVHRLSAFLRRHIGATKVAMAAVFAVLTVALILQRP
jgi:hypothetical protein